MKLVFTFFVGLLFLSGCSTLESKIYPETTASGLSVESQQVIKRPHEHELKYLGRTSGSATSKKLFGIIEMGDDAVLRGDVLMVGKRPEGRLEEVAAFRAVDAKGADAFYKLRRHERIHEWLHPMIYREKTVAVSGMAYEIKDLGPLDLERAEKLREEAASAKSAAGGVEQHTLIYSDAEPAND